MLIRALLAVFALAALGSADDKEEIKKLHEELAKRHEELDSLKQLVQKAMAVNKQMQDDNQRLRAELADAGAKQARFKNRLADLEARSEEMRRRLEQAKAVDGKLATTCLVRYILAVSIDDYRRERKRLPPSGAALWGALSDPRLARPLRLRDLPDVAMLRDGVLVDSWGHAIVYIHKNDYGKPLTVTTKRGRAMIRARKNGDGTFVNPTSYQLRSFGPNGVPDDVDDIVR